MYAAIIFQLKNLRGVYRMQARLDNVLQASEYEDYLQELLDRASVEASEVAAEAELAASQAAATASHPDLTPAEAAEFERRYVESLRYLEQAKAKAADVDAAIVSPETGRMLKKGSRTYQALIRKGYKLVGRILVPERVAKVQEGLKRMFGMDLALPAATSPEILETLESEIFRAEVLEEAKGRLSDAEVAWILLDSGFDPSVLTAPEMAALEEVALDQAQKPEVPGLEVAEGGKVVWFQPVRLLSTEIYEGIAAELRPGARYRMYVRTCADDIYVDGPKKASTIVGAYRGDTTSSYWRAFSLGDVDHGKTLTKGRLASLADRLIKDSTKGYVIGWLVALVPVGSSGARWLAMREGAENCVVSAMRDALGRKKGGLSRQDEACLEGFAKRVGRGGAAEEDVAWLCSQLKKRVELVDLEGNLLWGPEKNGKPLYANQRPVYKIYRSNGHAYFAESKGIPRVTKLVVDYADRPRGSRAADETLKERELRMQQEAEALIQKYGITRAYQVGREIIDAATGTLYRPLEQDMALCALEGCQGEGPDYNQGPDGETQVMHVGGVLSLAFKRWREQQGLESLPKVAEIRQAWREASFEAVPWASVSELPPGATCVDMRAAYLACDRRDDFASGKGHEWAERCGFPKGGEQRRALVRNLREVERLAGCVRFSKLILHPSCPLPLQQQIAAHLECKAWLTIPMALYLEESGLLQEYELEQVVYSVGRLDGIEFPNRDQAVRFVGSCSYAQKTQTFWTKDEAEADYYLRTLGAYYEKSPGGLYKVTYETKQERKDHTYVRAYVLGYMFIGMAEAIRSLPSDAVLACKVDSLTLAAGHSLVGAHSAETPKYTIKYGEFRAAALPVPVTTPARVPKELFEPSHKPPTAVLGEDPLYQYSLSFLDGQGGAGKTHRALRAFPGRKVVCLGKDNDNCTENAKPDKNPYGYPCYTYHEYIHLGADNPETWDRKVMGRTRPDIVVWDEIGSVPPALLANVLDWLASVRAVVVLCGDPLGQMQAYGDPYSGVRIMEILAERSAHVEMLTTDWRAMNSPELQALKLRMWRTEEHVQLAEMRQHLPTITVEQLPAVWNPEDTVVVLTNASGDTLGATLEVARAARHATRPVRYRFRPKAERRKLYQKKGGKRKRVQAPDGSWTDAVVGARATAPAGVRPTVPDWVPDSWTTVHSVQGKTIKEGRIYILDQGFGADWCRNAAYTAISRATMMDQLVRVSCGPVPEGRPVQPAYDFDDVY